MTISTATEELLSHALQYAERGLLVLPLHHPESDGRCSCGKDTCSSIGKHPRTLNGVKEATRDMGKIRFWWDKWQTANVGIATGIKSGIIVLDIDQHHGGDGSLDDLLHDKGPLPDTWESLTGGGGRHFFFKHPGGVVRNKTGMKPGIDLRGDGGYVVAPPSVHASGRTYEWDLSSIPGEIPLADAPSWLMEMISTSPSPTSTPTADPESQIPEGERNTTLTSLAGTMRRRGMGEDAILAALLTENQQKCQPPLEENEVRRIAASISRYPPEPSNGKPSPPSATTTPSQDYHLTDVGNAKRLVAYHGHDLRYCYLWGSWIVWDGRRWQRDASGEIERRAKDTARKIYQEVSFIEDEERRKSVAKHAMRTENSSRIRAMQDMTKSEESVHIQPHQLDTDPWLLNVLNGTLDLRTGEIRPHCREDLITKLAPVEYSPLARCPQWEAFLNRIMDGQEELIRFLQRAIGYSLTGSIEEQVLFILYGTGANGKSTLLEVIRFLLGDYAQQADFSTFLARDRESVRNDLASLKGARFVSASEVGSGRRLDEVVVKQITGGDVIRARFLYQEGFEYHPEFKLFLATNHKPVIRGTDNAIWRRIRLIPFEITIPEPERDRHLLLKLRTELPGILRWAVEGCLVWQEHGLDIPDAVRSATTGYRDEMDTLGDFLNDCCVLNEKAEAASKALYEAYAVWCQNNGEKPLSKNAFGMRLAERGFGKIRMGASQTRGWAGIGLKAGADGH